MTTLARRDFLGLSLAAGAALAAGPAFGLTRSRRAAESFFETSRIRDGLKVFGLFGEGGNSLLMVRDGASLLVDCKNAPFGRVLKSDTVALGAQHDPERLVVVNTHHHGDHTAGNHAFNEGSTIDCHANAVPRFEGNMDWYRSMGQQAVRQLRQMPPDKAEMSRDAIMSYAESMGDLTAAAFTPAAVITENRTELSVGDGGVTLHHFGPGHTDNDLVVHLEADNIIHTGDLVFHRVNPFMDANGGCNPRTWIDVLKRVHELCDADTVVIPGHGEVGDRSVITAQIEYIERLFEAVQAEIDRGTTRDAVVATTFGFQEGFGFDQGRTVANSFVYDMLSAE